MKKIFLLLICCVLFIACFFSFVLHRMHTHNTTISVRENADSYQFYASYNRNKMLRLQKYMDDRFNLHHFLKNNRMHEKITLNDQTSFYIRTSPGILYIKLDKNGRSEEHTS